MSEILINNEFKNEVINILIKANQSILDIYLSSDFDIKLKDDNSPLTEADLSAHRIITTGLKKLTPEIPIVSEEDTDSFRHQKKENLYWILDPLDGTKEFIKRSNDFTCNIGLIKNSMPFYGFVGVPTTKTIYHGGKNLGSYKRINDLEKGDLTKLNHDSS